jgi:peptidyl-prolyl cis-trans isomerase D
MMTKLREMTFVILWILVIAFVGLMVLQWGADITGSRGRSNVVGKIEGRKITIEEFEKALAQAREAEVNNTGKSPDFDRSKAIQDEVWDSYVQRILLGKEIEKYNIQVTDREVALYILNNPLPELQKNPQFQTDGKFDMQKYRQAVMDPDNARAWVPVEQYIRQTLPYQKLQMIITSSAMVTEEELKYDFMQKNMEARIEYLSVLISSRKIEVSEEEMKDYYDKNRNEFKLDEQRRVNYVLFSTDPSAEDTNRTYLLANDLLKQAREGDDFAKLADQYSEDPTVETNHGDLNYFEKSAMVPEFSNAAFSAKVGEVVGPVKTRYGLHIIKVFDKKVENGQEKVRASHILLGFTASGKTVDEAVSLSDGFREMAVNDGFQMAADQMRLEVKQTPPFANNKFIPGLGSLPNVVEWVFSEKLNEISSVHRVSQGYAVFQISEIKPEGYRPLEDVKSICQSRIEQEKRMAQAKERAEALLNKIYAQSSSGSVDFSQIAANDTSKAVVYDTTANFKYNISMPKIGRAPAIVAAAFSLPIGEISNLLESQRGYYIIRVLSRSEFNKDEFAKQHDDTKKRLLNQKKQQIFGQWYAQLKEKADIEDNRNLFYRG